MSKECRCRPGQECTGGGKCKEKDKGYDIVQGAIEMNEICRFRKKCEKLDALLVMDGKERMFVKWFGRAMCPLKMSTNADLARKLSLIVDPLLTKIEQEKGEIDPLFCTFNEVPKSALRKWHEAQQQFRI